MQCHIRKGQTVETGTVRRLPAVGVRQVCSVVSTANRGREKEGDSSHPLTQQSLAWWHKIARCSGHHQKCHADMEEGSPYILLLSGEKKPLRLCSHPKAWKGSGGRSTVPKGKHPYITLVNCLSLVTIRFTGSLVLTEKACK